MQHRSPTGGAIWSGTQRQAGLAKLCAVHACGPDHMELARILQPHQECVCVSVSVRGRKAHQGRQVAGGVIKGRDLEGTTAAENVTSIFTEGYWMAQRSTVSKQIGCM